MAKLLFLKTDDSEDPIGIAGRNPLFSWAYARENGLLQASYRIWVREISRSGEEGALCWDSGEVSGTDVTAAYAGLDLRSRTVYSVRLAVRTADGADAEAEGQFETALFDAGDWRGEWITVPSCNSGGALRIRKRFDNLPPHKKPVSVRAYVAGLGFHELYFNGKKVSEDLLSPALSDFSKTVYYVVYNLTELWRDDGNAVGVLLGHGWLGNRIVKAQFFAQFEDGSIWEDHTTAGSGWWGGDSAIVSDSIYGGETFDGRLSGLGWTTDGFRVRCNDGWMCAVFATPVSGTLRAQDVEPIRRTEELAPVSLRRSGKTEIYDFGVNFAGWTRIRVRGRRGSEVALRFAEILDADGGPDVGNLRSARARDVYILRGGGEEIWEPRFTYHGFRYAEAAVTGAAELLELRGIRIKSATEPTGSFYCSDPVVNRLHETAVRTEGNNQHSILTDCPQRDERFGWLNDLTPRIFQTPYNFGMQKFLPKILRDIAETQNERGEIGDTAPFYAGARPADPVSAGYLLAGLACCRLYGNSEILRREYPHFRAWTESLIEKREDGLLRYCWYGDWVVPACYAEERTDGVYLSTAFLFWHLECMSQISHILGREAETGRYETLAAETADALVRNFFDGRNFSTGTQTANALALELGFAPETCRTQLVQEIVRDVAEKGGHSSCGNQGYRPLFYALTEAGYVDLMLDVLTNPDYPGWGYMDACGATTVWERWERDVGSDMHSFDHPMFASYDAWLYAFLGGIRVATDSSGADCLTIKPCLPKRLRFVRCRFQTIRGEAACDWNRTEDGIEYRIVVPPNTLAEVALSGCIRSAADSFEYSEYAEGRTRFSLVSGEFRIVMDDA